MGNAHHLIDPQTKKSTNHILTVFTTHRYALFADMYATALFVAPLEVSLQILESIEGLEAMIITNNGAIYTSRGFQADLF
jgi:thiamine biosynthesis lipoprotein ApbE